MKEKKVVLVTGGTSGIGYGILKYLLDSNKYESIMDNRFQLCYRWWKIAILIKMLRRVMRK